MPEAAISKTKALDMARRANARARAMAQGAADQADKITGFGVALGASAGMAYYMAKSTDTDGKWWGMDKEIWVAGLLAALSFWLGAKKDRASQMTSSLFLNAATGVGAAYVYGVTFQRVSDA